MTSQSSALSAFILAVLVAIAVFAVVATTIPGVGLTWDEPAYMGSAQSYGAWFTIFSHSLTSLRPGDAFGKAVLDQYWQQGETDLHPPLGKIVPALTWRLFRDKLGDLTAMRLGNAAIFAALVGLVCLMGTQLSGAAAGLFAAASLTLMPRMFFHAHVTALDIPVAFAWLLTVWVFWHWTLAPRPRLLPWLLVLALAYGLALGTKNTSFILPGVLLVWGLLFRRTRQAFMLLIGMVVLGGVVFVVTWPSLYRDLPGQLSQYLQRVTVGHWDIPQYYLGTLYTRTPWHYPFVITLAVVPSTTLAMALLGAGRILAHGRGDPSGWLVLLNVVLPLAFFAVVSSQAYGGERLFIAVFPFLALLAGISFDGIWEARHGVAARLRIWSATQPALIQLQSTRRRRSGWRWAAAITLFVLLLTPGALGIIRMHPYELSYFSEAMGGLQGAQRLGLEVTYWCETYRAALPFLNSVPEQAASVWTEEDGVLYWYQKAGMLRQDIQVGGRVVQAGPLAATYALIQNRPSGFTAEVQTILRDRQPEFVVSHDGVPLAYVFKIQ